MFVGDDNNPTLKKGRKKASLYDAKIRRAAPGDFTYLVSRGSRRRPPRWRIDRILIVVRLYSRRYCRVGIRNVRQISLVGGGIAFGKT